MEGFLNIIIPQIKYMGDLTYWLIFFICVFETIPFAGIILPATVVLALAGFLASIGILDLENVASAAIVGAIAGDALSFYIGKFGGRRLFSDTARIFHTKYIDIADDFFHRHGGKSIFWGRFASPIRPFIAFTAGLGKMNEKKFWFYNIVSAPVWAGTFICLGFIFGEGWQVAVSWIDRVMILSVCVVILAVAVNFVIRRFFFRKEKNLP
jgi:membrane protein DedA with SNARE-associated domain